MLVNYISYYMYKSRLYIFPYANPVGLNATVIIFIPAQEYSTTTMCTGERIDPDCPFWSLQPLK